MTIAAEEPALSFAQLVDRMTQGEPVTVTRQGKIVGQLLWAEAEAETPIPNQKSTSADAVDRIRELRKTIAPGPPYLSELLAEGQQHSYEANHGK